jgi:predicted ATPase
MKTLRAAIDWSYELLDEGEKRLFERLSVFQGGRTIQAAEAVCNPELSLVVLDG